MKYTVIALLLATATAVRISSMEQGCGLGDACTCGSCSGDCGSGCGPACPYLPSVSCYLPTTTLNETIAYHDANSEFGCNYGGVEPAYGVLGKQRAERASDQSIYSEVIPDEIKKTIVVENGKDESEAKEKSDTNGIRKYFYDVCGDIETSEIDCGELHKCVHHDKSGCGNN